MNISLELPEVMDFKPRISVVGVGGAGCNAINNMIATGLDGVEFVAANTDAQSLAATSAEHCIQLGAQLTEGLGAGANPQIGLQAAEEAIDEIRAQIGGSHMLFLAAGMGGGTGTGAIPVIAEAAREMDILTVAIVSKPFHFEGARRMSVAESGIKVLRECVDTLIVIPNQNLFNLANEKTTFAEAFVMADQVLYSGIACIVDLIVKDGHINLDFADVKAVMKGMGAAMMGTGEASGQNRAIQAAQAAISNPLLTDISLRGAQGLLISIIGGSDLTLYEVDEAASCIKQEADTEANIIVGATFEEGMDDRIRVSIVASGLPSRKAQHRQIPPSNQNNVDDQSAQQQQLNTSTAIKAEALADSSMRQAPHEIMRDDDSHTGRQTAAIESTEDRVLQTQTPPLHTSSARPPKLPQNAHATAARDPYLGQTSADEFARALSEVIGTVDEESEEQDGQVTCDHHLNSSSSWQSPDGVVIEDGFEPVFSPPSLDAEAAVPKPHAPNLNNFQPAPPAQLPRRLPDVSDFPHIAQRAYEAKTSKRQEKSKSARDMPSILKRLANLGRQKDQLKDESVKVTSNNNKEAEVTNPAAPGNFFKARA